jgi:WD40 repeat protein
LALRQAPKLERDKHPNLIRVPSKSSWSTGNLANLFGYSSSFQNDIGDSFIDFMDIRTADSTGISINYKKSHTRSPAWITDFSFSPDGNFIQSSGADNRIFVHDIRHNSQILAIFEHDSSTITSEDVPEGEFPWDGVATEWSSDSQYLVSTADDCSIRIWDIYRSEKQSISTIRFDVSEGRPQTLSLSSDHDSISIGTSRGIFSRYSIP